MRGFLCLGVLIGTAAAASGAMQSTNPAGQADTSAAQATGRAAPDPIAKPSAVEGEIVVTGRNIPITKQGAWVFRRSDIVLLGRSEGPLRLVPAANWAACMPAAQTDAMVRWLAQTGPYLSEKETNEAIARMQQAGIGGGTDTNGMLAILPSNLTCYPPRHSTLDGGNIDVLQYCRQRKVAMGSQRRAFDMRLLGHHTNTAISMRFSINETTHGTSVIGAGMYDPSQPTSYGGLNRPDGTPRIQGSSADDGDNGDNGDTGEASAANGLQLRMAIEATWRTSCPNPIRSSPPVQKAK